MNHTMVKLMVNAVTCIHRFIALNSDGVCDRIIRNSNTAMPARELATPAKSKLAHAARRWHQTRGSLS